MPESKTALRLIENIRMKSKPNNMTSLFLFSQIDPLDNTQPDNIKNAVIMTDSIFFEIVENGEPKGKTKPKTQFLLTQIEQFNIPHIKA
jgi:hypothetical protein